MADPGGTPQVFKSRYAAYKWLADNGYKVKKSKVYMDADAGLLRVERDGTVTIESVRRYIDHPEAGIREHLETAQAGEDREIREYNRRTAIAKMKIAEADAEKKEFDLEKERGLHIPRADLEMEMAGRAAVLEQGLRNLVQIRAEDWVHLVGGDVNRAGELRAAINSEVDHLLNRYVTTESFSVMFDEEWSE